VPTSLTVSGNTRLAWSLSDTQTTAKFSGSAERLTNRSITNGTGVNQATVAFSRSLTITGTNNATIALDNATVTSFDYSGKIAFTNIREQLVSVSTGPTGGWVLFSAPAAATGISGIAVRVGGQLHLVDYATGVSTATGSWTFQNGPTGTYGVDFTVVGLGTYAD